MLTTNHGYETTRSFACGISDLFDACEARDKCVRRKPVKFLRWSDLVRIPEEQEKQVDAYFFASRDGDAD